MKDLLEKIRKEVDFFHKSQKVGFYKFNPYAKDISYSVHDLGRSLFNILLSKEESPYVHITGFTSNYKILYIYIYRFNYFTGEYIIPEKVVDRKRIKQLDHIDVYVDDTVGVMATSFLIFPDTVKSVKYIP